MTLTPYRRILAVPQVRTAVLLGVASRMPMFAGGVLITLHVVTGLGRGYAQAGVVTMAYTTAVAVAGPWRGRVLDRRGLRRAVLPSLILMTLCWSVAPFVEYAALLALAIVAGLVNPPVFAIVRQAMMTAASPEDRRTALSLDAVAVEVSFMIGPLLAVWAATTFPTSWSLYVVQMLAVAAAAALWVADPPLTRGDEPALPQARAPARSWAGPSFWATCLLAGTSTVVLTGTDLGLIAGLREIEQTPMLGPVLSVWGLGSAVGGLLYGGLRRPVPAPVLLVGLGAVTLPLAWAQTVPAVFLLAGVAGLLCAPVITATVDELTAGVPESAHGEAIGWHGSFLTGGSAVGAPVTGLAIDAGGAYGGFVLIGAIGMGIGGIAVLLRYVRGCPWPGAGGRSRTARSGGFARPGSPCRPPQVGRTRTK
ncbi:MAG: MFS transporter [Austwickia sp.]|nr:MFS transporter [Austwickia sp.]